MTEEMYSMGEQQCAEVHTRRILRIIRAFNPLVRTAHPTHERA